MKIAADNICLELILLNFTSPFQEKKPTSQIIYWQVPLTGTDQVISIKSCVWYKKFESQE